MVNRIVSDGIYEMIVDIPYSRAVSVE